MAIINVQCQHCGEGMSCYDDGGDFPCPNCGEIFHLFSPTQQHSEASEGSFLSSLHHLRTQSPYPSVRMSEDLRVNEDDSMTRCKARTLPAESKEEQCQWYKKASHAPRCMYYRPLVDCCDKLISLATGRGMN